MINFGNNQHQVSQGATVDVENQPNDNADNNVVPIQASQVTTSFRVSDYELPETSDHQPNRTGIAERVVANLNTQGVLEL